MLRETGSEKREDEQEVKAGSESAEQTAGPERGPAVAEPYPGERPSPAKNQQQHYSDSQRTETSEATQGRSETDIEQGRGATQTSEARAPTETEQEKVAKEESRPEQTTEAPPAANLGRATEKGKRFFNQYGGAGLVIVFASFVLLVQSSAFASNPPGNVSEDMPYVRYAVAFSVITLVLGIIFLVIRKREWLGSTVRTVLVVLLFLWCIVSVGIFTFRAPFTVPGNGYFMSWIIFFAAYFMLKSEVDRTKKFEEKLNKSMGNLLFPLLLASLVNFFSALALCTDGCGGNIAYGVSVGVVSFFIVLIYPFIRTKLGSTLRKIIAGFLVIWWLLAAFILTFGYPFQQTGNGYFSVWIAFFLSVLLLETEVYG